MRTNRILAALFAVAGLLAASAASSGAGFEDEDEARKWQEMEVEFPAFPKQEGLIAFYVSAVTENRFFVDPGSISIGGDGVVRYVLVVESGAGARNVSYEGMRCEARERRLYAFGRSDGAWSKSRNSQWERVREAAGNRHHAALFQEYFCPGGVIVSSADEARDALRRGGHPSVKRW